MADTGKLVTKGLHAGAVKYVITKGLTLNPGGGGGIVNACFITKGLGTQTRMRPVLHGMATNPVAGPLTPGSVNAMGSVLPALAMFYFFISTTAGPGTPRAFALLSSRSNAVSLKSSRSNTVALLSSE